MSKELKENINIMSTKKRISIKRLKLKKNQIEIPELKSKVTEMKQSLEVLNSIFELTEEAEDKSIKIVQWEAWKEK